MALVNYERIGTEGETWVMHVSKVFRELIYCWLSPGPAAETFSVNIRYRMSFNCLIFSRNSALRGERID